MAERFLLTASDSSCELAACATGLGKLKVGQGDVCEQGCWNHSHKQTALSAEGKAAILSPYFHYHHLILHNKHVGGCWGRAPADGSQEGGGKIQMGV